MFRLRDAGVGGMENAMVGPGIITAISSRLLMQEGPEPEVERAFAPSPWFAPNPPVVPPTPAVPPPSTVTTVVAESWGTVTLRWTLPMLGALFLQGDSTPQPRRHRRDDTPPDLIGRGVGTIAGTIVGNALARRSNAAVVRGGLGAWIEPALRSPEWWDARTERDIAIRVRRLLEEGERGARNAVGYVTDWMEHEAARRVDQGRALVRQAEAWLTRICREQNGDPALPKEEQLSTPHGTRFPTTNGTGQPAEVAASAKSSGTSSRTTGTTTATATVIGIPVEKLRRINVGGIFTIGSEPMDGVCCTAQGIQPGHAQVERQKDQYVLRAVKGSVTLRGRHQHGAGGRATRTRLTSLRPGGYPGQLHPGDEIIIGSTVFLWPAEISDTGELPPEETRLEHPQMEDDPPPTPRAGPVRSRRVSFDARSLNTWLSVEPPVPRQGVDDETGESRTELLRSKILPQPGQRQTNVIARRKSDGTYEFLPPDHMAEGDRTALPGVAEVSLKWRGKNCFLVVVDPQESVALFPANTRVSFKMGGAGGLTNEVALNDGDAFRVGNTTFTYHTPGKSNDDLRRIDAALHSPTSMKK